jgi:hypothetical protein
MQLVFCEVPDKLIVRVVLLVALAKIVLPDRPFAPFNIALFLR